MNLARHGRSISPIVASSRFLRSGLAAAGLILLSCGAGLGAALCPAEREAPILPANLARCAELDPIVRKPRGLAPERYQARLAEYFRNFCHRNEAIGWSRDKSVRDTGPFVGVLKDGKWEGTYYGTHAPVVTWYSPEMVAWLKAHRPDEHVAASQAPPPVPDGAFMVKEMFPPPAAACASVDPLRLMPNGAAIMVRDQAASHDGWYWGWFGWGKGAWRPDWPAPETNDYPFMGFGLYCTNCHASARDNYTFASLRNMKGQPGEPLVFLSHTFVLDPNVPNHHEGVAQAQKKKTTLPDPSYLDDFTRYFQLLSKDQPARLTVPKLPSETYDYVWTPPGKPTAKSQMVTSSLCVGCHSAGGTGLQFDMTLPGPGGKLINLSPYGTWKSSPKGMSGRDPIFFAQLASETETFHPESSAFVQDTCLGCHAIQGQRQFASDGRAAKGACAPYSRKDLDATPFMADNEVRELAHYAALARDGVSCTACHSMVLGKTATEGAAAEPHNACVVERQQQTNPGLSGLAKTFTGNFLLGPPGDIYGPFEEPRKKPMVNATGMTPVHSTHVKSPELCASCHTVHLPVLHRGKVIGRTYEQATYPEWAFSAYRTGTTPDGDLPYGRGETVRTCQDCHMPSRDSVGRPVWSKIATIQEYSNFPQAEHTLPPADLDLPVREGFARHTLVGLNIFLIRMAQQFPYVLGLRTEDPMLAARGIDSLTTTGNAIVDQASHRTADVTVSEVRREGDALSAKVTVTNFAGHKFPSGVAFRRAFIEFSVLDAGGQVLWSSGRTNRAGVLVDDKGEPIAGEFRWRPDCSARIDPAARVHQPHRQVVTRQDQAQIYEELVSKPPDVDAPVCGANARPDGELTTSFLSICAKVKDNRLLPAGFLPLQERTKIAEALGADHHLAEDVAPVAVGDDPDYRAGGRDTVTYRVPLADVRGKPAAVRAALYYQATPPYYLQDRFCTSKSDDTARLYYLAGKLNVSEGPIRDWKLQVGKTATVELP